MKKIIYTLFFAATFFSCEEPIEFNGKETAPLLVVNSVAKQNEDLSIWLSKSVFFLSEDENTAVENADIQVFVNDNYAGNCLLSEFSSLYKQQSYYHFNYTPQAGDKIRYEISVPNFPSVSCETAIPHFAEMFSLDAGLKEKEEDTMNMEIRTSIEFKDNPNEKNYYRITGYITDTFCVKIYDYSSVIGVYTKDSIYSKNSPVIAITSDDKIFTDSSPTSGLISGSEKKTNGIFSDDLIGEESYRLDFTAFVERQQWDVDLKATTVTISLQSISYEYYMYLRTLAAQPNREGGMSFSEPVQIFNNIKNGIGIFGSYSESKKTIELPQKEWDTGIYYKKN